MSTNFKDSLFRAEDWISQTEAARLRKVTKQAISKLVKRGRIRHMQVGGHILVLRQDAENFERRPAGRPAGRRRV